VLTVVTPADSQDLVTLDAVKSALGVTDNKQDDALKRAISQASGMIAKYCNRVFIQETVTETFRPVHGHHHHGWYRGAHDRSNRQFLLLSRRPVTVIANATEFETIIDPTGYALDANEGSIERLCGDRSAYWHGTCVVSYTGGYALAAVPPDLQGATIDLVTYIRQRAARDPTVRSVEIPGVINETFQQVTATGIPDHVSCVIDEYRNPSIG
jgi:hypothetical protein